MLFPGTIYGAKPVTAVSMVSVSVSLSVSSSTAPSVACVNKRSCQNSLLPTTESPTISASPSFRTIYSTRRKTSIRNVTKKYKRLGQSSEESIFDTDNGSNFQQLSTTSICSVVFKDYHPLNRFENFNENFSFTQPIERSSRKSSTSSQPPVFLRKDHIQERNCIAESADPLIFPPKSKLNRTHPKSRFGFYCLMEKLQSSINLSSDPMYNDISCIDQEIALETFSQHFEILPLFNENISIDSSNDQYLLPTLLKGKCRRVREVRTNPNYLLLYSIENCARQCGILDVSSEEVDIFDEILLQRYSQNTSNDNICDDLFRWRLKTELQSQNIVKTVDQCYITDLKLASLSRYKLLSKVTLDPRTDSVPSLNTIIDDIYPKASVENCPVPWLSIHDFKSGKAIQRLAKTAGMLKFSSIQYVSRNCSSKRWSSSSASASDRGNV